MSAIAIIPARGGSKRIPRKNVRHFLGRPIIAYSIEAAIKSQLFDEVMVSTDDDEISQAAIELGASVPFRRSDENSDDFATTVSVLLEVLSDYKKLGREFTYGCCIYPTAPFVNGESLKLAFEKLIANSFDSVFPIVAYGYPVQRSLRLQNGLVKMVQPQYLNSRSQDLEKIYHDCGQFYWFSVLALLKNKVLFSENAGAIIVSENQAQDIDSEVDWKLAELKYQLLNEKKLYE